MEQRLLYFYQKDRPEINSLLDGLKSTYSVELHLITPSLAFTYNLSKVPAVILLDGRDEQRRSVGSLNVTKLLKGLR